MIFIEVFFPGNSLEEAGFQGRDEVEDPLYDAFESKGIGEVSGGGGGIHGSNIDIEISDSDRLNEALDLIKSTLYELKAPKTSVIEVFDDVTLSRTVISVYG